MATSTRSGKSSAVADVTPQVPQGTPHGLGGGGDYSPFVWQQLGDIQKTLGRLESCVEKIESNVDKLDSKVDRLEMKISGVTHKIYAATVVLGIFVAIGVFVVNKAWDLMAQVVMEKTSTAVVITPQVPSTHPQK